MAKRGRPMDSSQDGLWGEMWDEIGMGAQPLVSAASQALNARDLVYCPLPLHYYQPPRPTKPLSMAQSEEKTLISGLLRRAKSSLGSFS